MSEREDLPQDDEPRLELTDDIIDVMIDADNVAASITVHVDMMVESGWVRDAAFLAVASTMALTAKEFRRRYVALAKECQRCPNGPAHR